MRKDKNHVRKFFKSLDSAGQCLIFEFSKLSVGAQPSGSNIDAYIKYNLINKLNSNLDLQGGAKQNLSPGSQINPSPYIGFTWTGSLSKKWIENVEKFRT